MSAFEGYMTFGGVELLNNPRVRGIAESAQPCPMYWLRGPECDTLADALGQVGDYNWNRADRAPWYDPDLPDVSSRFFGIYAYSIGGIYDSTRRADVTESTLDGGVIGATRKGSKRVTVRAIVMARGRDALEYGMTWLNGTLDPDGCGKTGGNCETADIEFLVDCPPPRPNEWIYGAWSTIWANLATNPSFETASGTVEVRRNLVTNPSIETDTTGWSNGGVNGTMTRVAAADAAVGSAYLRLTRINTTAGNCYVRTGLGTVALGTYTVSAYVRGGSGATRIQAVTEASGGAVLAAPMVATVDPLPGQWTRITGSFTVTTAGTINIVFRDDGSTAFVSGATYDIDGVLIEASPVVGTYFDGGAQPKVRRNFVRNPSFEVSTSDWQLWAGGTLTRTTAESHSGIASLAMAVPGSVVGEGVLAQNAGMPTFAAGTVLSASAWLKVPVGMTVKASLRSNSLGSYDTTMDIVGNGAWQKATLSGHLVQLGSGVIQAVTLMFRTTAAVAGTFYLDEVLAEVATTPGTYFDGATGAPAGFTAAWEGTANTSPSYLYDSDLAPSWTGAANASASVLSGALTANTGPGSAGDAAYRVSSTRWAASGSKSARLIPSSASTASRLRLSGYDFSVFQAGKTYTVLGTLYMEAPQSGTVASDARRIVASTNVGTLSTSSASPNAAGAYEHRLTFTVPPSATWATVLLMNGASLGNGDVWWDNLLIIEGTYDGPYFDGSTPNPADDGSHGPLPVIQNIWTGTANASTSQQQLRSATLTPVSDVTYAPLVNESRRFLKGGSVISGPFITDTKSKGEFWAHWVEFTFAVEKPWVYQKTTPLTLTPSLPTVVQDVPYNLAPYPSAELASGTVIVAENLSTNPSVETNATGWTASGSAVSGAAPTIAGARSTELAASGLASFLATATGTGVAVHDVIDYQDVTVAPVTGSRYSFTIWGAMLFTGSGGSGISLGAKVEWRNGGGTVLRTDTIGTPITSAFAGQVFALKSVAPPAGAVTARVIVTGRANFTASTVAKVFADALAVSIP